MNLLYVADPMCSWCYGFGRTIGELLADPRDAAPLRLAIVMGGLRPGTREPMTSAAAERIFEHWRHVEEASGRRFAAAGETALDAPDFVYDTEPACRATVTVRSAWPKQVWRYFEAVQHAFYAEGRNVARPEVLADLAAQQGIARAEFDEAFSSQAMRDATEQDFAQVQTWGIRGFPTLLAERGEQLHVVCHGYLGIDALRERLSARAH